MNHARQTAAVLGLLLVLTVVLTWPLATVLPSGVRDLGDPLLVSWTLAWDVHALRAAPARLFDANVFHPHRHTLAYTEPLLGLVPLAAPVLVLDGGPVLAHNLVLVATFVLAGLTMFWLVRDLSGHAGAATVAAVLYAFSHYRFTHISHLQLLSHQWLPLGLLGLHRALASRGRWRDVGLAAGAFALQALSCGYYAYVSLVGCAVFALWAAAPAGRPPLGRALRRGLVVAGAVLVLLVPLAAPYLDARREVGLQRSFDEVRFYSAVPSSYLAAPRVNRWLGPLTARFRRPEGTLLPGVLLTLLATLGAAAVLRGSRPGPTAAGGADLTARSHTRPSAWPPWLDYVLATLVVVLGADALVLGGLGAGLGPLQGARHRLGWLLVAIGLALLIRRRWLRRPTPLAGLSWLRRLGWPTAAGLYVALAAVGVLCSFGPILDLPGGLEAQPLYGRLYRVVPGFDGLRVPSRFAVLVTTGLGVLAGFGAAALARGLPGRRARVIALVMLGVLGVAETWSVPLPLLAAPVEAGPSDRWLAASEPGPVVTLPMYGQAEAPLEARRMLASVAHWRPRVNGYAGFFPRGYWDLVETANAFPAPAAVRQLRLLGVRYVVIDLGPRSSPARERWVATLRSVPEGLVLAKVLADAVILEIRPP